VLGGGEVVGAGVGVEEGNRNPPSPHIYKNNMPACTLISTPAVARNGLPKIIGKWGLSSVSRTKKSHGMTNSPTLTGTFSRTPTDCLIEQYAN